MAAIGSLNVELRLDDSDFTDGLRSARSTMASFAEQAKEQFDNLRESVRRFGTAMTIGVTVPTAIFARSAVRTASDAQELQSAFNVTFGAMSNAMNAWAESTGNALGRSTQEMQRNAQTLGIIFNTAVGVGQQSARLSQQFSVLAQDLSSFFNTTPEEALIALRAGLIGEAEPLRRYGVLLSDNALRQEMLRQGIQGTTSDLSEQQKVMLRSAIILQQTGAAQGDVVRTSAGFANQLRELSGAWEELKVRVGAVLLPIATTFVRGITALAEAFNRLPPAIQNTAIAFAALAAAIGPLSLLLGPLAAFLFARFVSGFGLLGTAIGLLITPIATLVNMFGALAASAAVQAVIAGLGAAFRVLLGPVGLAIAAVLLFKDEIGAALTNVWNKAKEVLGPRLQALLAALANLFQTIASGPIGEALGRLGELFGELLEAVGPVVQQILELLGTVLIHGLAAVIEGITGFVNMVSAAFEVIGALLRGDFSGAWEAAKRVVAAFITGTLRAFEALVPGIGAAVQRIYTQVRTWLVDRFNAIVNWVRERIESIKNFFRDLYVAVVGNSYIPDMVDEIAQHMRRLDAAMVVPARDAAEATRRVFEELQRDVSRLMDNLFPEARRMIELRRDLDLIANPAAGLTPAQQAEARRRLYLRNGALDNVTPIQGEAAHSPIEQSVDEAMDAVEARSQRFRDMFRDTFQGGIMAAMDGDLGRWFDGWWRQRFSEMLGNLLERLADTLVRSLESGSGGKGGGGLLGTIVSGIGMLFSGNGALSPKSSSGQVYATGIKGFARGGSLHIGGYGGVDRNLLSLNGSPIARVSRGERLDISPANDGGRSRVEIVPSPYFDAVVDGRAARVATPMAGAAAMGGSAQAQRAIAQRSARQIP